MQRNSGAGPGPVRHDPPSSREKPASAITSQKWEEALGLGNTRGGEGQKK